MGLQKIRADRKLEAQPNGAVPWVCEWMGGPTLAKVQNCPIHDERILPRTVYPTTGEPDSLFTIPAVCRYKGKRIVGYLTWEDGAGYEFKLLRSSREKL